MLGLQALVLLLPVLVASHGVVVSPAPRVPGPASLKACGNAVTDSINADPQGSIEQLRILSMTDSDYDNAKCEVTLCKGLQLEDNKDRIQNWFPGQEVNILVASRIPHTGWVSVAVVDTATRKLVGGTSLVSFETTSFSGYSSGVKPYMDFNVTIPKLYPSCTVPGECVSYSLEEFSFLPGDVLMM
jgi:hypothetical protein